MVPFLNTRTVCPESDTNINRASILNESIGPVTNEIESPTIPAKSDQVRLWVRKETVVNPFVDWFVQSSKQCAAPKSTKERPEQFGSRAKGGDGEVGDQDAPRKTSHEVAFAGTGVVGVTTTT